MTNRTSKNNINEEDIDSEKASNESNKNILSFKKNYRKRNLRENNLNEGIKAIEINVDNNLENNILPNNGSSKEKKIKKIMEKETEDESRRKIIKFKKNKKKLEYIDEEINELSYGLAIKNDKRTYCQFYFSLLRTNHNLFFTFFNNNDYNSKIIKIDIFFINFITEYTINGLFFDDNTMHKIYETKGSFNLEYQLPKIIYSFLISSVINILLKTLALSNGAIINLKNDKSKDDIDQRRKKLENSLRIKFVVYFVLGFIFLIFFWYYISMFDAIYKNTQYHLLKDALISFGLSLIYPFFINLLPGFIRIHALSDPKKNRECLYNFSKVLQKF